MYTFNNEINGINSDINLLSLKMESAFNLYNKILNNDITTEQAQGSLIVLYDFETPEELTGESAEDKKSILQKVIDFIKKMFLLIKNAIITMFKKIQEIYYRVSKQAYKIENEIKKGQFNLTDSLIEKIRTKLFGFNIDNKTQPIENFSKYFGQVNSLFIMNNLKFNSIGDHIRLDSDKNEEFTNRTFVIKKIENKFYEALKDINSRNPFLDYSLAKNILGSDINSKILFILGYNPLEKKYHVILKEDSKLEKVDISKKSRNDIFPKDNIEVNMNTIGKIVNICTFIDGDIKSLYKRLETYLNSIKIFVEDEIEYSVMQSGYNQDTTMKYVNSIQNVISKLNNDILTIITSNSVFISNLLNVINEGMEDSNLEKIDTNN